MDYFSLLPWILLSWVAIRLILSLTSSSSNKRLPPGPIPWPIVGNLFLLGDSPHESMTELAKLHGPLMYLRLGSLKTVVVSSASMAKEVLGKNDASLCSRMVPDSFTALQHHEFSFLFMPVSERWRSFRRISNSHVLSGTRLDASRFIRRNKLEDLISYVRLCSQAGEAVDVGQVAFDTALNIISNIFFSVDLAGPNSSTSREFKEVFSRIMLEATKPNFADYFPVLKRVDPQMIRRRMEVYFGKITDHFSSIVSQRLAEKDGSFDEKDALDAMLRICHENGEELQLHHIPHMLLEIFLGGTDTTSGTVQWAMTELLCNTDKMNKARQELELVVGKGVAVKEEDIPRLPYLQAVIRETLRKHGPAPFLFRRASSNVEICGFTIPKNSQILINVRAIGKDPSLWENPGSFEPERFLGREIDVKGRDFDFIPFGAGRRSYPGMPLVMRVIPLVLGTLINCFDWKLEDGVNPKNMNMDATCGLSLQKTQPLRAIPFAII